MKTEIEEIKKIIANCEKMLGEIESELLKESKPEFKVGDWVYWCEIIRKIKSLDPFEWFDNIDSGVNFRNCPNEHYHATSEEIKEHLTKEFNKRGYSGKYIEVLVGFHKGEISNEPLGSILYYNIRDDSLSCSAINTFHNTVYKNGE